METGKSGSGLCGSNKESVTDMIRVRLNSATQVTKEKLQQQLKQLNCTYTVGTDKNTISFSYPTASAPIISLLLDSKANSINIQLSKINALKGSVNDVAQRMDDLQEEINKALQSMDKLTKWLNSENGLSEVQLLINE